MAKLLDNFWFQVNGIPKNRSGLEIRGEMERFTFLTCICNNNCMYLAKLLRVFVKVVIHVFVKNLSGQEIWGEMERFTFHKRILTIIACICQS